MRFLPPVFLVFVATAFPTPTVAEGDSSLEFGEKPFQARTLEFEVAVPKGWDSRGDHRALIVQAPTNGPAFRVTREPMLWDPKQYAALWKAELDEAGVKVERIEPVRAGGDKGWKAQWGGGGRTITACRIHAGANEMLYNFAFSVPAGYAADDLDDLLEGVLRSFKCTAPKKPKLRFKPVQFTPVSRARGELPDFFVKQGGRMSRTARFAKIVPGYAQPRVAAEVLLDLAKLPAEDCAKITVAERLKAMTGCKKTPRAKKDKLGKRKGFSLKAKGVVRSGIAKEGLAFVWPAGRQHAFYLIVVVDRRETRLYKKLLKEIFARAIR